MNPNENVQENGRYCLWYGKTSTWWWLDFKSKENIQSPGLNSSLATENIFASKLVPKDLVPDETDGDPKSSVFFWVLNGNGWWVYHFWRRVYFWNTFQTWKFINGTLNKSGFLYRLNKITPLVTGVKSYLYICHRLEEITPLVTDIQSYIHILPTGRNYAVCYWLKIIYIYIYIYIGSLQVNFRVEQCSIRWSRAE